ncbi:serine hydrolase [Alteromonas sp. NFXS44]|uniref:serine hydrolase domain-containing protein n=1 Tax=Alteromonas sp. NFXS44 TaxID=2818435 RepID=UPI0032DEA2BC
MKPAGLVASLLLMTTGALSAEPDYDKLYLERFNQVMADGGMMLNYSPMEKVAGATPYTPLPVAEADEKRISQKALDAAANYAQKNNSSALLVWKDGKIQYAGYYNGYDAGSQIVSKSLSKPLTAITIGRAIKLGFIGSVDQSVAEFIPEWKGTAKAAVKIRHLLNMHSGLLPQGYSTDPAHPWNTAYLSYQHGDVLINDYPLVAEPGTTYGYNNATAELVAIVIERATGQRYADFLSNEVLAPLGAAGGEIWVDRKGGLAHSGCCMTLPAETWLRLAVLLLNNGKAGETQLLPKDYVQTMTAPSDHNPHYGLGVWLGHPYKPRRGYTGEDGPGPKVLHSEPYTDPKLYLFDGNANQVVYIMPSFNTVVLRTGAKPPRQPEWDNSVLPNLIAAGL